MIRWAIVCCSLVACAGIPEFQPSNGVSVTAADSGGNVVGRNFALHFETGASAHFPDSLTIDGVNVLGHNAMTNCADGDLAGLMFIPMDRIAAGHNATSASNWFVEMHGPAVAKVELEWEARWTCQPTRRPGGRTLFTMFPDGRIVRHDRVGDTVTDEINPTDCTCSADNQNFLFASFWAFQSSLFNRVTILGNSPQSIPEGSTVIANLEVACLDGNTHHIGYSSPSFNVRSPATGTVSMQTEYNSERPTQLGEFMYESKTTLVVDSTCDAAINRADATVSPPTLIINDANLDASALDGIYGGENAAASAGYELGADHATIKGTLPASFAVQLRFNRDIDALHVEKNQHATPYIPQRIASNEWLLWFEDGLAGSDSITVEPL